MAARQFHLTPSCPPLCTNTPLRKHERGGGCLGLSHVFGSRASPCHKRSVCARGGGRRIPDSGRAARVPIPCGLSVKQTKEEKENLYAECERLARRLKIVGVRAKADLRHNYSPGWPGDPWGLFKDEQPPVFTRKFIHPFLCRKLGR